MTAQQLEILQHALGVDRFGAGEPCRRHFVTEATSGDGVVCEQLVTLGHMRRTEGGEMTGGMPCYLVTESGRQAVRLFSPARPRQSRGQRRYEQYLRVREATGMSFREFLREYDRIDALEHQASRERSV